MARQISLASLLAAILGRVLIVCASDMLWKDGDDGIVDLVVAAAEESNSPADLQHLMHKVD